MFFFFATASKADNYILNMLKSRIDRKWRHPAKKIPNKPKLYQLYFWSNKKQ